jgi:hypothetical protein
MPTTPAVVTQTIGGIWTSPSSPDLMLSTQNGQFFFYDYHDLHTGNISVSGSAVTGTETLAADQAYGDCGIDPQLMFICEDLSSHAVTPGTVSQQSNLTFDGNTWTYSSLYGYSSSFAQVAGTWTGDLVVQEGEGDSLVIGAAGAISEVNKAGTCTLTGQVSLIDPSYNAYALSITYTGQGCEFNGATGTGIAYLDYTVSPTQMEVVLDMSMNGTVFGVIPATETIN